MDGEEELSNAMRVQYNSHTNTIEVYVMSVLCVIDVQCNGVS